MIRFINDNGEGFDGIYPYVHWIEGQLSVGLWYTLKLMIISNSQTLSTSELDSNSIFRFIDQTCYSSTDQNLDLSNITLTQLNSTGQSITISGTNYYLHQILIVCKSDVAGVFTEQFTINDKLIEIGIDLYEEDEILSINLTNRGMDLPISIQKAFLENNLKEANIDFALINRKFKELISNYLDIIDCKGSYQSLYNSLKWFEWGDSTKLYEIWKDDQSLFEKELTLILNEAYSDLITTHQKTTHLSLVTALQEASEDYGDESREDYDRNPKVKDIAYQWTNEEMALKTSILGAFFERYFMPIHLDLKRAAVEALVYTNQIKLLNGSLYHQYHYHDDTGVIDVLMDHNVALGNIKYVAVGKDTVFGVKVDSTMYDNIKYIQPIGVQPIENIENITSVNNPTYANATDGVATFYTQLEGGVGVIVPIKVRVDLPQNDGIITEVINIYKENEPVRQLTERRLYMSQTDSSDPDNIKHYAEFEFNLLSTKEETVIFTLTLYSLSGHVWTTTQQYNCVDVRGSFLDIYKVENTDNSGINPKYSSIDEWLNNKDIVPYTSQNPIYTTSSPAPWMMEQFLPYSDNDKSQFNQLIITENFKINGTYDDSWFNQSNITDIFWVIGRTGLGNGISEDNTSEHPRYIMLITKKPGRSFINENDTSLLNILPADVSILRMDMIYIPQLHEYTNIENDDISLENYTFNKTDLLCVVPQFKSTIKIDNRSIKWEYINKTNFDKITTKIPVQTPLIASKNKKLLSSGYWTVNMYYKLEGSNEIHKLTKNSAFKIA